MCERAGDHEPYRTYVPFLSPGPWTGPCLLARPGQPSADHLDASPCGAVAEMTVDLRTIRSRLSLRSRVCQARSVCRCGLRPANDTPPPITSSGGPVRGVPGRGWSEPAIAPLDCYVPCSTGSINRLCVPRWGGRAPPKTSGGQGGPKTLGSCSEGHLHDDPPRQGEARPWRPGPLQGLKLGSPEYTTQTPGTTKPGSWA